MPASCLKKKTIITTYTILQHELQPHLLIQSRKQVSRLAIGIILTYENVHSNVNMTLMSRSPHHISLLFCIFDSLMTL